MKTSLHIPEKFKFAWATLAEIARREGRSRNQILLELAADYVRRHEPGNPQIRIDVVFERGTPPSKRPTCSSCLEPATYICYLRQREFGPTRKVYACDRHRRIHKAGSQIYGEQKLGT